MKIIEAKDYEHLSELASNFLIEAIREKPNCVLGLATGSTPILLYKNLIKAYKDKKVSFANVKTFNLDEYLGVTPESPNSYHYYMKEHLFDHVDLKPENTFLPKGLDSSCLDYESLLEKHPIDLQVLGLGSNGHIGFNEPGASFTQGVHITLLAEQTRFDNRIHFSALEEVPKKAITMGIKNILSSKKVLLLVNSESKKEALKELRSGVIDRKWPVTALNKHQDLLVIAVKAAL